MAVTQTLHSRHKTYKDKQIKKHNKINKKKTKGQDIRKHVLNKTAFYPQMLRVQIIK
jgi:hypothetical protein